MMIKIFLQENLHLKEKNDDEHFEIINFLKLDLQNLK